MPLLDVFGLVFWSGVNVCDVSAKLRTPDARPSFLLIPIILTDGHTHTHTQAGQQMLRMFLMCFAGPVSMATLWNVVVGVRGCICSQSGSYTYTHTHKSETCETYCTFIILYMICNMLIMVDITLAKLFHKGVHAVPDDRRLKPDFLIMSLSLAPSD